MSDQPSTSASGQEKIESQPGPSSDQPSSSTSQTGQQEETIDKKTAKKMKKSKQKKNQDLLGEPTAEELAEKKARDLNVDVLKAEMDLRFKKLSPFQIVNEFTKLSREIQDEMVKKSFIRRMMVWAAHSIKPDNQNNTMNMIKKITKRKKCPVEMDEIEFCLRRLNAHETLDMDTCLEVLLEQENMKKRMLDTPENPDLVHDAMGFMHQDAIIDCIDIRVNMWMIEMTFLGINIGGFYPSSVLRNKPNEKPTNPDRDQTTRALIEIVAFLETCKEEYNARILRVNVTIGGDDLSRRFLTLLLDRFEEHQFNVDTFQLKNIGTKISDSLLACKAIRCQVLEITVGRFLGDDEEKFAEAILHHKNRKNINITSKDVVPTYFRKYETDGIWPFFEVTTGLEERTGDKYVLLERTDRRAIVSASLTRRRTI